MLLADEETIVIPQQAVLIPPPKPHKISNIGESDLVFLAVCAPAWEPTNTVFLE
jgi:mannose-6-phosphate isomerase-like protein (cupin superfamily)